MAGAQTKSVEALSKTLHRLRVPKSAYAGLPRNLTDAAMRGDVAAAAVFIANGEDVSARTIGFASPLHAACSYGHVAVAQLLFEHGAPLQTEGELFNCIHFAISKGYIEVVRWAVAAGLAEKVRAEGAKSALAVGQNEIARFLRTGEFDQVQLEKENSRGNKIAVALGDESCVLDPAARAKLIEQSLQMISTIADVDVADSELVPPLVRAAITGVLPIVVALLERGANPNAAVELGVTALGEASALGFLDIAEHLVISGADVNLRDGNGRTALSYAAARGDVAVVEFLLGSGANKRVKDTSGKTPLKYIQGPFVEKLRAMLK